MPAANQSRKLGNHMLRTGKSWAGVVVRMSSQTNVTPTQTASIHSCRLVLASTSPECRRETDQAAIGNTR